MKLIIDEARTNYELVVEQKNPNEKKKHYITGPFLVSEVRNQNKRIYSKKVIEDAVKVYNANFIEKNTALGELNHPATTTVDYERAVIKILELNQDDNVWYGKAILMEGLPLADLLKTQMFDYGVKMGVSSRGCGTLSEDGKVDQDYILNAVDIVNDPSATLDNGNRAWVDGILESKQFMLDSHGELVEMQYNKLTQDLKVLPVNSENKALKIKNILNTFIANI